MQLQGLRVSLGLARFSWMLILAALFRPETTPSRAAKARKSPHKRPLWPTSPTPSSNRTPLRKPHSRLIIEYGLDAWVCGDACGLALKGQLSSYVSALGLARMSTFSKEVQQWRLSCPLRHFLLSSICGEVWSRWMCFVKKNFWIGADTNVASIFPEGALLCDCLMLLELFLPLSLESKLTRMTTEGQSIQNLCPAVFRNLSVNRVTGKARVCSTTVPTYSKFKAATSWRMLTRLASRIIWSRNAGSLYSWTAILWLEPQQPGVGRLKYKSSCFHLFITCQTYFSLGMNLANATTYRQHLCWFSQDTICTYHISHL